MPFSVSVLARMLASVGLAFSLEAAAAAQSPALPSREELRPSERSDLPQRQQELGVVGKLAAGPCPFESSELRFVLQDVSFDDLTAVAPQRLAPAWSQVQAKEISVNEICRIRDRAAQILLDEGYLARVEIPPQEINGGRVHLQVVEARIASTQVRGSAGSAVSKVRRYVEHLRGLSPVNLNDVQREILLASDVPGVSIAANLRPASGAPGAVELIVDVNHQPLDLLAAGQNYSSSSVGRWTALARVDLNSLTPLGERTSLVFSTTSDFHEQQVLQLLEEFRIGSSGLLATGSIALGKSHPAAELKPLDIDSDSLVADVGLAYPIVRHRRRNLWLSGGLEFVNQSTDVFNSSLRLIDDQLRVVSLRLDGDRRYSIFSLPVSTSVGVELRKGLDAFGASEGGEATLSRAAADPQAWSIRVNGRSEVVLLPRLSFATASLFQWAEDPLLAYEELSIGNYTIGRGYDPGALSGDRAWASSLELRYGPFNVGKLTAQGFGFFDSAWVDNLDPGSGDRRVQSIGGGFRIELGRRFGLDVAYAHPMDAPVAGGRKPNDRLLINLTSRIR